MTTDEEAERRIKARAWMKVARGEAGGVMRFSLKNNPGCAKLVEPIVGVDQVVEPKRKAGTKF
jgi:hypothetical protein